ncbi:MAG: ABC transporter permease [Acidimicrobiales bacterium]|jgi:ABC-2 type transport system permease protein
MSSVESVLPGPARRESVGPLRMIATDLKYQQLSYWRNRFGAFFTFFMPIMFLVIFGSLDSGQKLSSSATPGPALNFDQYFVPAILTLGVISSCYTYLAVQLTTQREEGLLKRVRSSPLPPWAFLVTVVLSCLIRTAVLVGLTLGIGAVFYHLVFPAHAALALLVTLLMGTATFCSIGIAITVIIPNADAAPAVVNGIYLPLMFISGTFFPLSPGSQISKVAAWFPVQPFVKATFAAVNPNVHGLGIEWGHIVSMAIWGAVAIVIALRRFRWMPSRKE